MTPPAKPGSTPINWTNSRHPAGSSTDVDALLTELAALMNRHSAVVAELAALGRATPPATIPLRSSAMTPDTRQQRTALLVGTTSQVVLHSSPDSLTRTDDTRLNPATRSRPAGTPADTPRDSKHARCSHPLATRQMDRRSDRRGPPPPVPRVS